MATFKRCDSCESEGDEFFLVVATQGVQLDVCEYCFKDVERVARGEKTELHETHVAQLAAAERRLDMLIREHVPETEQCDHGGYHVLMMSTGAGGTSTKLVPCLHCCKWKEVRA